MPRLDAPGWRGRIGRGIVEAAGRLESMSKADAMKYMCSFESVGGKTADVIYDSLFAKSGGKRGIDKLRAGDLDIFPSDRYLAQFRKMFLKVAVDLGKRETDEPVTSDVKRLIRLVSSLHGKTGLVVIGMKRDQLDDFRPLRDAVAPAFRDDPVRVEVTKAAKLTLRGETFNLSEGLTEVPEYAAVFMTCRGLATIPQVSA
jgi:DNA primase small subunit